jgi:hypothetical protein
MSTIHQSLRAGGAHHPVHLPRPHRAGLAAGLTTRAAQGHRGGGQAGRASAQHWCQRCAQAERGEGFGDSSEAGRCRLTVPIAVLKAPMVSALKPSCHKLLSSIAFDFNLRRYSEGVGDHGGGCFGGGCSGRRRGGGASTRAPVLGARPHVGTRASAPPRLGTPAPDIDTRPHAAEPQHGASHRRGHAGGTRGRPPAAARGAGGKN